MGNPMVGAGNVQIDFFRNLMDAVGPVADTSRTKYEAEAKSARATELRELMTTRDRFKELGDDVIQPIDKRIRALTKEISDDLVSAELLRGRDTDLQEQAGGKEKGGGNGGQVGAIDTNGERPWRNSRSMPSGSGEWNSHHWRKFRGRG